MALPKITEKFILHWGEMGTRWGVNRTVSQIHALLYLSDTPLQAEEISETLGVARSNVSNSLKELLSWQLIRVTHILGDRRDHFECKEDIWEIFTCIAEERKKREIDPTLAMLRECVTESNDDKSISQKTKQKIVHMSEFVESMSGWYQQMNTIPRPTLMKLMKLGSKITKFLGK